MNFKIRPLNLDDERKFIDLVTQYIKEYLTLETLVPAHFDQKYSQFFFNDFKNNSKSMIVLVAEENSQLLGFCYGYVEILDKWSRAYYNNDSADIYDIFVKPEYRKQGISKTMISAFEEEAKKRGLTQVTLKDVDTKNIPAQKAYTKQGYSPWNTTYFKKI